MDREEAIKEQGSGLSYVKVMQTIMERTAEFFMSLMQDSHVKKQNADEEPVWFCISPVKGFYMRIEQYWYLSFQCGYT